jgi:hypothetical protein
MRCARVRGMRAQRLLRSAAWAWEDAHVHACSRCAARESGACEQDEDPLFLELAHCFQTTFRKSLEDAAATTTVLWMAAAQLKFAHETPLPCTYSHMHFFYIKMKNMSIEKLRSYYR